MGVSGENSRDPGVPPLRRWPFWRKVLAAFGRQWAMYLIALGLLTLPPFYEAVRKRPGPADPAKDPRAPNILPRPDLKRLVSAMRDGDDAAILAFFRSSVLTATERGRIRPLVDQLGADSFAVRRIASAELEALGPRTAPLLSRALSHPDPEVVLRARELLTRLARPADVRLLASAVRRLGQTRPPDTIAVLLDYLPDAEDNLVAEEVRLAVAAIAGHESTADPTLLAALHDAQPEKRSAAGVALCRRGAEKHRPAIRKLLDDSDTDVRHRTALALLAAGEKEALLTLIDLLPVLAAPAAWMTLDLLYQAAGVEGPAVPLGEHSTARVRCRDVWRAWWTARAAQHARVPEMKPTRGPTLLVEQESGRRSGQVHEVGPDGKPRWHIPRLDYPVWAEALSGERVLIVEHRTGRVGEWDRDGNLQWNVQVNAPVYAHRLADGRTFVAGRSTLWEVDRSGKMVVVIDWPARAISAARRLDDGRILILTDDGTCIWLDAHGREIRRFETGCKGLLAAGIDVTANSRVLVPDIAGNRIREYSASGELLWEAAATRPVSVQRLADGSTLVASAGLRDVDRHVLHEPGELRELDRLGRVVWSYRTPADPVSATRRSGERGQ